MKSIITIATLGVLAVTAQAGEFVGYKDGAKVTLTDKACNKGGDDQVAKMVGADGKRFDGCWKYSGEQGKTFVNVVWYAADGKPASTTEMDATQFSIIE